MIITNKYVTNVKESLNNALHIARIKNNQTSYHDPLFTSVQVQLARVLSPVIMAHINGFITNDVLRENHKEICIGMDREMRWICRKFVSSHQHKQDLASLSQGV